MTSSRVAPGSRLASRLGFSDRVFIGTAGRRIAQAIEDGLELVAPPALRDRYLPGLLAGDKIVSMGISEPDAGSNVLEIRTRARRDGDHFVINGEKTWISNGVYSDFLVCTARTGDDPRKGLTHFLLDRAERRGAGIEAADIYYRRTMWLILFGLLHAYLIWSGDILYAYGVVGLLLFPLRKLSAKASR